MTTSPTLITNTTSTTVTATTFTLSQCKPGTDTISLKCLQHTGLHTKPRLKLGSCLVKIPV